MLVEKCRSCHINHAKVRCIICTSGYCHKCGTFVKGMCTSCLKIMDTEPNKLGYGSDKLRFFQ